MKRDWEGAGAKAYFVLGIAALAAVPLGLWWAGLGVIGLLAALPILAWIASRLIVHGGGQAFTWLSRKPYEKWEGNYYAFNDTQVRIFEDEEGGELWFVVADVVKAVGMKRVPDAYLATHPAGTKSLEGHQVMNPAALEALLGRRNERESIRFIQWMRREVVKPWERRRERA